MVVLAPGTEIKASDIPADILEGAPTVLPVLAHANHLRGTASGAAGAQGLDLIRRGRVDLRMQVGGRRRRPDERLGKVQVIEVPESAVSAIQTEPAGAAP